MQITLSMDIPAALDSPNVVDSVFVILVNAEQVDDVNASSATKDVTISVQSDATGGYGGDYQLVSIRVVDPETGMVDGPWKCGFGRSSSSNSSDASGGGNDGDPALEEFARRHRRSFGGSEASIIAR